MSVEGLRNMFLQKTLCSQLLNKLALMSTHCSFLRFVGLLTGKVPSSCMRCLGVHFLYLLQVKPRRKQILFDQWLGWSWRATGLGGKAIASPCPYLSSWTFWRRWRVTYKSGGGRILAKYPYCWPDSRVMWDATPHILILPGQNASKVVTS